MNDFEQGVWPFEEKYVRERPLWMIYEDLRARRRKAAADAGRRKQRRVVRGQSICLPEYFARAACGWHELGRFVVGDGRACAIAHHLGSADLRRFAFCVIWTILQVLCWCLRLHTEVFPGYCCLTVE